MLKKSPEKPLVHPQARYLRALIDKYVASSTIKDPRVKVLISQLGRLMLIVDTDPEALKLATSIMQDIAINRAAWDVK